MTRVLRSRNVLTAGIARSHATIDGFHVRQLDDIVKHGFRECDFSSCDKVERSVKEFAFCSGCRSVWYCSAEHQALDWGVHKKACSTLDAARKAETGDQ